MSALPPPPPDYAPLVNQDQDVDAKAATSTPSADLNLNLQSDVDAEKLGADLDTLTQGKGGGVVVRLAFMVTKATETLRGIIHGPNDNYQHLSPTIKTEFALFEMGFIQWSGEVIRVMSTAVAKLGAAQSDINNAEEHERKSIAWLRQRLTKALQLKDVEPIKATAGKLQDQGKALLQRLQQEIELAKSQESRWGIGSIILGVSLLVVGLGLCLTGALAPIGTGLIAAMIAGGTVVGAAGAVGVAYAVVKRYQAEQMSREISQMMSHISEINARVAVVTKEVTKVEAQLIAEEDIEMAKSYIEMIGLLQQLAAKAGAQAEQELKDYHEKHTNPKKK